MRYLLAIAFMMSLLWGNPSIYHAPHQVHAHEVYDEVGQSISYEHSHIQIHEPLFTKPLYENFHEAIDLRVKPALYTKPSSFDLNSIFRPPIA